MLDRETKIKNTIIGRLMALFVAGVVCFMQAIPVFADDDTKISISSDDITMVITTDSSITMDIAYNGDPVEVIFKVPLYFRMVFNSSYNNLYLSGTLNMPNILSKFTYTVNGFVPKYLYFEPVLEYGYQLARVDANCRLTLDNFFNTASNAYDNNNLLGYMYFSTTVNTNQALLSFTNSSYTVEFTNTRTIYATTAPFGYVNAMIYALNNSANIEDMLSILNSIDANMLPEILTVMRSNHTALYNLIQNVWTTDQAVLSVDRQIYNTVLSILAILEDAYGPQASQAENIKEEVDQNLDDLISDMELTKPSQVANIADDYIAQIDTSYNNLAFGFLSNNTIVLMLCIVAGLAIISYMLYGGQ